MHTCMHAVLCSRRERAIEMKSCKLCISIALYCTNESTRLETSTCTLHGITVRTVLTSLASAHFIFFFLLASTTAIDTHIVGLCL